MQRSSAEKTFAQLIIIFGFVIMILGTYANLNAIDMAKSGSHLEEKPAIIKNIVDHPKDIHQHIVDQPKDILQVPIIEKPQDEKLEEVEKIVDEIVNQEAEVKVSEDGIKKEEQVIADEKTLVSKDPRVEIQEKNEEIQELKDSKDKLEKEVLEMKEELVKQNKETQQLVLQKFGEIAEKVDKIEKQSGPSAKEKPPADEQPNIEEQKPVLKQPILGSAHAVAANISETEVLKKPLNVSSIEVAKEPEPVQASENQKENLNDMIRLEDKDKDIKDELKPVDKPADSMKHSEEPVKKDIDGEASKLVPQKLPSKPETRGDPIVKLIKSQEPLSYQVGEKMMETKKTGNATIVEIVKLPELPKHDSVEEIKNEMRRKRETFDDALSSLDMTRQNFELKSIISRDLKATSDDE